jgi:hypothetical protein
MELFFAQRGDIPSPKLGCQAQFRIVDDQGGNSGASSGSMTPTPRVHPRRVSTSHPAAGSVGVKQSHWSEKMREPSPPRLRRTTRHAQLDLVSPLHALVVRMLMRVSTVCPMNELAPSEAARVHAWTLGSALKISRKERYEIDRVVCLSVEHHEDWAWLAETGWLPRLFFQDAMLRGSAGLAWLSLEWWDGTGPGHLKGEQIPLAARIAATAQAWSAVTAQGSAELSCEHALAVLETCSGTRFDPNLVETTALVLARSHRERSRWLAAHPPRARMAHP